MYFIRPINVEYIAELKEQAIKEGLLFPKKKLHLLGMFDNQSYLVGFGGWILKGKHKAIIKCFYIRPEYRKQGLGRKLIDARMQYLRSIGIKRVEANVTKLALNTHRSAGAKVIKQYKNGITHIVYEDI